MFFLILASITFLSLILSLIVIEGASFFCFVSLEQITQKKQSEEEEEEERDAETDAEKIDLKCINEQNICFDTTTIRESVYFDTLKINIF